MTSEQFRFPLHPVPSSDHDLGRNEGDANSETLTTWISDCLNGAEQDRQEAIRHVMATYFWPLHVYARRVVPRWLADPVDVVCGFFADRLLRDGYLRGWRKSGLRLRRWLMNGLFFYVRELKAARKATLGLEAAEDVAANGDDPGQALERAFARHVIVRAFERACELCQMKGLAAHWEVFELRYRAKMPYEVIARERSVTAARAAVMARTASQRFKIALRELLIEDGADPDHVDEEIGGLLLSLRT